MSAELKVVRGNPSPEELAAVVVLLTAASGGAASPEPEVRSLWAAPQLRGALHAGPGAWRASGLRH